MSLKKLRFLLLALVLGVLACGLVAAWAEPAGGAHAGAAHSAEVKEKGTFEPEYGTWFHPLTKRLFNQEDPKLISHGAEH